MKQSLFRTIFMFCLLLSFTTARTQTQDVVNVTLNVVPPYPIRLTDFAEQPGKVLITLQNKTQRGLSIYLRVTITGDNGVSIATNPSYIPPTGITLQGNQVLVADYNTVRDLFDTRNLIFSGINANDIRNRNGLPEGTYTVCVRAYWREQPGAALSGAPPFGCATFRLTSLEPPILIRPMEDDSIRYVQPQNVIFSWTIPAGVPPGTRYRLRIIEMLDSKRNINDAMLSSTAPAFFETTVQGNIYVYGPADPPLVPGRKYAWAVTALDEFLRDNRVTSQGTAFRNGGRSEVRGFIVKQDQQQTNTVGGPASPKKPGKTGFQPNLNPSQLNVTTFKGKLVYAFRKTEKEGVIKAMPPYSITTTVGYTNTNAASIIENTNVNNAGLPISTQKGNSTGGGFTMPSIGNGTNPAPKGNGGPLQVFGSGSVTGAFLAEGNKFDVKTKQQQLQEKINELADEVHYPLANTEVQLDLYIDPNLVAKMPQIPNPAGTGSGFKGKAHIYLGKVKTDAEGNFTLNYYGEALVGYQLTLSINNPYFEFAETGIYVNSDTTGTYNVGELLGLAKTYRFKVKVVDEDGNKLETAVVSILRSKDFYGVSPQKQSLTHEVMHDQYKDSSDLEPGRKNSKVNYYGTGTSKFEKQVVGKGGNGDTFTKMFMGDGWNDMYYVRVSLDSTVSKTYTQFVQVYPGGYVESGVPVIEKTLVLPLPNPYVTGKVVSKNGGIPIKDAIVTVAPKQETTSTGIWGIIATLLNSYTAKTDAEGKFSVENIAPSASPYIITVQYKSKSYEQKQPVYLTKKGTSENRDPIELAASLNTVCGKVKDAAGNPVANAALHWKNGGEMFYTNETGDFITAQAEGKYVLVAMAPGFKDKELEIDVKEAKSGSGKGSSTIPIQVTATNYQSTVSNWSAGINGGKTTGAKTTSFNKNLGVNANGSFENGVTATEALYSQVFKNADLVNTSSVNCDQVITLTRFFVKAKVKDASSGNPVANATIKVDGGTVTFKTGADGTTVISDVPSGSPKLITSGPADAMYETSSNVITVDNTKDTMLVEIPLKAGSKVSGKVNSNSGVIKQAEVFVEGKTYIKTKTDNDGNYTLTGVPEGEYKLIAAKSGLLSDDSTITFVVNTSYTVNFDLKDPGFNASSIYGFPMFLDEYKPGAAPDEFIIKGRISDFPDNAIFKKNGPVTELTFANLVIKKSGDQIFAKDGEVKLDVSEIPLQAFTYLKVKLSKSDGLRIKPIGGDNSKGEISGEVVVDLLGSFSSLVGWQAPSLPIKLTAGSDINVGAITSNGNFNGASLKLGSGSTEFKLYTVSFKPDWPNCEIGSGGLTFKGVIKVDGIPLLSSVTLNVNKLAISKNGKVTDVDVDLDPKPEISILSWKLKVNALQINNSGLKFGGDMSITIPGSPNASIGFSDLAISSSGISGGSFYMPDVGIDLLGVVKFTAPMGSLFSFQKIPASTHYQLIGAGNITFPKLMSKGVELKNFSVGTNGNLAVAVKTDFTVGFADMASLNINTLGFDIGKKQIDVGGKIKLNIPGFGIGAGGLVHYKPGSVWLDELGIEFSLSSAVQLKANVAFKNENEFSGDGYLKLAGLSDGIGLGFKYKKLSGGMEVGATFKTGMVIPIGVVKLDQLAGGFNLNTATSVYTVFAQGRITLAPDPAGLIALDPVKVTITSTPAGPTLLGEATVKALGSWDIGKAELKIDFPNRYFYIDGKFGGGFSLMKGLNVDASSGLHIEANVGSDPFWFVSGYTHTSIAKVFDQGVTIIGGWNVAKTQHASLSVVPDYALYNGRIYGGYFSATSHIGGNSPEVDIIGLAAVSAWYNADGSAEVYANFKTSKFGLKLNQSWNAGGKARIYKLGDIASANITLSGSLEGNYSPSGWGINGNLSGSVNAHLGCNGGCGISWGCCFDPCFWDSCEICPCPCGVKVCASASVTIGYNSTDGFSFSLNGF
ncbi:MAG: carboxypeptidase regulatory-like domain-containing protein [Chitinophagaceae bacterium]